MSQAEVARLASLIERVSGNVIPEGQFPYLERLARERAKATGVGRLEIYVDLLETRDMAPEWRTLLPQVTINESYLFRIPEHFEALSHQILPELLQDRPADQPLRVWSAGCACGEEAVTLAMVLTESPYLRNRPWSVLATDVDDAALEQARRGEYGPRAVARVPEHLLRHYFERRKGVFAVDPAILERIEYRPFNLVQDALPYLDPTFDLVFLRNVLIYFRPELQRQVISRLAPRLAPEGYLFLGHSESLWRLSEEMVLVELAGCFAYRRSGGLRRASAGRGPAAARPSPPPGPTPAPAAVAPTAATILPPPSSPPGPDTLARAQTALSANRLEEAHDLIAALLETHRHDVRAHALHGLIHDVHGHTDLAVAAYRAALYLDEELFQVRFLLASRLEALGSTARARSEYRHTLSAIEAGRARPLVLEVPHLLPGNAQVAERCRLALARLPAG